MFAATAMILALGGDPAVLEGAFCRDLGAFTAAASEAPQPFASIVDPANTQFGAGIATRSLTGFGPCTRYLFDPGWTISCHGPADAPLAEAQPALAARVGDCLDLPPIARPPNSFGLPATEFRAAPFTVVVETKSCDRCRGMPQVTIRIIGPRGPVRLP